MRVIAGSARSIALVAPPGEATRPTTDRIKETLFNMISYGLPDCRFLDLFSGSGAVGIEALSRGASEAVFVEKDKAALACIAKNLQKTRLSERARVLAAEAGAALRRLEAEGRAFDYIFMDPPYRMGWEERMLELLRASSLCAGETTVIIEAALDTDFGFAPGLGFEVQKEKRYKTNKHVFLIARKVQQI